MLYNIYFNPFRTKKGCKKNKNIVASRLSISKILDNYFVCYKKFLLIIYK